MLTLMRATDTARTRLPRLRGCAALLLEGCLVLAAAAGTGPAAADRRGGDFAQVPLDIRVEARRPPTCHEGPCNAMKHGRLTVNPQDGLIYWHGGDFGYEGPSGSDYPHFRHSARQEIFSYDIRTDEWRLVMPYCTPNNFTFGHPDQHGWVWDSRRERFWALPGQQRYFGTECDGLDRQVMGFNPQTAKWQRREGQTPPPRSVEFAVYDAETDKVYLPGPRGGNVLIWDPQNHEWENLPGTLRSRRHAVYAALAGRSIYNVDFRNNSLIAFDIDRQRIRDVADLPWDAPSCPHPQAREWIYTLHLAHLDALFVYDWGCSKSAWLYWLEQEAWQPIDIGAADGRHLVYHPGTEQILIMGDSGDYQHDFDNDDATPYLVHITRRP